MKSFKALALVAGMASAITGLSACSPTTLVERAIEDRSSSSIVEDNRIAVDVNKLMAKYKTASVSTEVYEQRLLVYGIMDDKSAYDGFRSDVKKISGIKRLYWHVAYMTEEEQKAKEDQMTGFAEGIKIEGTIAAKWIDTKGVESANLRIAVDPMGTAYVMGLVKSADERSKALEVVRNTKGVRRLVDYLISK